MAQNVNKLKVYQLAKEQAIVVYKAIQGLPQYDRVRQQVQASSTSVTANLVEMASYTSKKQQRQKLETCIAEAGETIHWIEFLRDTEQIPSSEAKEMINQYKIIKMMLINLKRAVEREI